MLTQAQTKATPPRTPVKPQKGLRASKFAEELDSPESKSEAVQGEQDSSSAALASVGQPSLFS